MVGHFFIIKGVLRLVLMVHFQNKGMLDDVLIPL